MYLFYAKYPEGNKALGWEGNKIFGRIYTPVSRDQYPS